jgi:hypothetical protein
MLGDMQSFSAIIWLPSVRCWLILCLSFTLPQSWFPFPFLAAKRLAVSFPHLWLSNSESVLRMSAYELSS